MSPNKKKTDTANSLPFPKQGDGVVISGIAGRFPESDNLTHLKENLFNKRDLITDDDRRWKFEHPDVPRRTGKVNNVEKFDARFFGISSEEAQAMDPMGRMLLEHAYEAIVDAGINPRELRGTNTGVFIGTCFSESERDLIYERTEGGGLGVPGCSRGMLANRISHWLGTVGPSCGIDSACSGSLFSVDHAYRAIRLGQCDAALVGASQLCLNPLISMQLSMMGALSSDGYCRTFDADANGYCRAEAICVIFLQKATNARRIYADVIYTKTNCDGFTEQGITFPSSVMQGALLQQFYEECKIPPTSLAFVEAHGTGTKVGDPIELNNLERAFCPGRTTPLRIGCIKSNLGHTEAVSGACSIAKVLIAMESGYIPPNLHYNRPGEGSKALVDGRIIVVTEPTPWDGGYVGVNSFGFGGANAHVLLKSNPKKKNNNLPKDDFPRLVVVSGRTRQAVTTILDDLESRPVDVEYVSLFHNIHSEEIPGHLYRGYTILPSPDSKENCVRDVHYYPRATKRPTWFMFSGIGYPWIGMGEALLKIPVFFKAVQKCDVALKPYGLNVIDILTTKDPKIFNNILNFFVGAATVQIGLVDLLASIGIVPDNIIGHSIGELGCAYADGCWTAEQTVLAAYHHGLVLMETETISQSAAVPEFSEMGIQSLHSPEMEISCHNVRPTISWASDAAENFVINRQNNILHGEIPYNNVAYRSCNIRTTAETQKLVAYLQKVITDPRPRSEKWLSTSVARDKRNTSSAKMFSPEYDTKNILNPVRFDEISHVIPRNAIVIEIAPHVLLKTILQSSSNAKVTSIDLTSYGNKDPLKQILQAIGKMYQLGLHPQLTRLYAEIKYPVSCGTPMISPLVRWQHSDDWFVSWHTAQKKIDLGERVVRITISDDEFDWMAGHIINGRNLVPASSYLVLVWETLALMRGELYNEVSVVFEDIKFRRTTAIPKQGGIEFQIMIQKGSGRFEVTERDTAVVTGFIRTISNTVQECVAADMSTGNDETLDLTDRDIYKEFRVRGYQYAGLFRGLKGASLKGTRGLITWKRNWVAFIDSMIQLEILQMNTRSLYVPKSIQRLMIDAKKHSILLRAMPDDLKAFAVEIYRDLGIILSGGVEIRGLRTRSIARNKATQHPVLEKLTFVAHRDRAQIGLKAITRIATHIALENNFGVHMKTIELISNHINKSPENLTSPLIQEILNDLPSVQADVNIIAPSHAFPADSVASSIKVHELHKLTGESDALLVVSHGILTNKDGKTLKQICRAAQSAGFLLAREPLNSDNDVFSTIQSENLDVIFEKCTDKELILLLRKRSQLFPIVTVIQIDNYDFTWLYALQAAFKTERENTKRKSRILLVNKGDFDSGLLGLVNCLRKEPGERVIQGLLIQDPQAPKFSLKNPFYSEQLDLGLALNVLRPGKLWGSYRFFALDSLPVRPVQHLKISQLIPGDLSSLKWVENKIPRGNIEDGDIVQVYYSSISFHDVMISTGKLSPDINMETRKMQEDILGFEYSGKDVNGHRVMGIIPVGAFSDICVPDSELLWSLPDHWTLEDAATIPLAYSMAYFALMVNCRVKKENKVLIHAGSGGVGQAAITLALHEGCEVFTTAGTTEKRNFIKNHFPQIDYDHIGNSRDTSFEQLILRQTQGRGVDIVLNSLAGEKLQASIRCLRNGGRFLDISKFDSAANNSLGLEVFLKGISYHSVQLNKIMGTSLPRKRMLAAMLAEGIKSGAVKPLVRTVFTIGQTETAFRYMAAGKHIGKVILKIRDEGEVYQVSLHRGLPRYYCPEHGSTLILGGLGGFGLELADWLVIRGARKLVLTSRKGITTGYQRLRVNLWKSYGVKIVIIVGKDASTPEGCEDILKEAAAIGPVDAIFNLAAVIRDSLFENQTIESFEESFKVKAWTTRQLDKLSRTLCPHLRHFVVFSSVSCGRGNAGQTNYGMSNSVMERICERRAEENLPGLAIEWGAIGDVGLVAEMQVEETDVVVGGTVQQKISSCLRELDGFLLQDSPVVSSMVIADKIAAGHGPINIVGAITSIMGLKSLKTVSLHKPLMELGLDSMMAIEIKMTLERDFEIFLTPEDIRRLNFVELDKISLEQAGGEESCEKVIINDIDVSKGLEPIIKILHTDQMSEEFDTPLLAQEKKQEVSQKVAM